jgi:hypothetical protein
MTIGIDAYPLAWPEGWKRTKNRKHSAYKVSFSAARDDLAKELSMLARRHHDVVISSNVPTRRDGLPMVGHREPDDPGVAAYWIDKQGRQRVIACDTWRTVRENLRAVGLAVGALRLLERTGASEILERAFTGFAALPPQGGATDWPSVLGIPATSTAEHVRAAYQELAFRHHPDRGGDAATMAKINAARDAALKEIGAR